MRIGLWGSLVFFVSVAHADTPIDLTRSVPTTIAVSSTVDNAAIKPEHIADGKLDTAWNSQTGDLTPHVLIRVPAETKVTAIKLTAGFTKVDKKLGDLFTMNPRIKRVRVSSGGKSADFTLDVAKRTLQELAIDLPPGDLHLAVLASEPGTKKSWREISISELEVWGTTKAAVKPQKPALRLRSLDALPTLTKAECTKVLGKLEGKVRSTDQVGVSADLTVCRADVALSQISGRVILQAASRKSRSALGASVEIDLENGKIPETEYTGGDEAQQSVSLALVPLRTTEQALSVTETRRSSSMHHTTTKLKTTLYRVTSEGLDALIAWDSIFDDQMESNDATECTGPTIKPTAAMPKKLKVVCTEEKSDWHNPDPSQQRIHETTTTKTYVWNGTSYDEK
ncbi:MAG: NADase-type glycan-binding domain-containing protein [Kofleriaceae bacterium]